MLIVNVLREYSYTYTIPYMVLFLILCSLYWIQQRSYRKSVDNIAFIILLIFIGLRGFVASDYISYYPFFEELSTIDKLEFDGLYNNGFEFGFVFYSSIIKSIFPNYFFWMFINSLIDLLVFYWFFKKYSLSVLLSFIAFLAFQGLTFEFNLYRNSKSFIFFLLSFPYLEKRKLLPYSLLNSLGCLFHLSSFLYLPMYFVLTKKIPKMLLWGVFIIVNIMYFSHISMSSWVVEFVAPIIGIEQIYNKMSGYFLKDSSYGFSIGYFERTISFIIFVFMSNKLYIKNEYNRIFINGFFIYYISFYLFADIRAFAERIPTLFMFSYWMLYPNILGSIKRFYNRKIVLIFILLLCSIKIVDYSSYIMSMYDNLLWGISSYEERLNIARIYLFDN